MLHWQPPLHRPPSLEPATPRRGPHRRRRRRLRPSDKAALNSDNDWIWPPTRVHQPLIDMATYQAAQHQSIHHQQTPRQRAPRRPPRPYVLRVRLRRAICQRRMEGTWNHDRPHYRCRYPSDYALTNSIRHPRTVYVREAAILPGLDRWLAQLFDHQHLDATCHTLAAATAPSAPTTAAAEAAPHTLRDCDQRLARYRAALDAGADPALVAAWIAETQAERATAQQAHAATRPAPTLTAAEIRTLIDGLPEIVHVLADAPPHDRPSTMKRSGWN